MTSGGEPQPNQAVILAGGMGTRLRTRLHGLPKCLVRVCGTPLLERQLRHLCQYGFDDIVFLGNKGLDDIKVVVASLDVPARVRFVAESTSLGTAGALLAALDSLSNQFAVIYGDTLINVDLSRVFAAHRKAGADATLFLHPNDHPQDSDLVELDDAGWITAFHRCPHTTGENLRNLANAGLYIMDKRCLSPFCGHPTPCDLAKDLFPAMLAAGAKLHGYVSFEYIKDVGTPDRLEKVELDCVAGVIDATSVSVPQKAVFLDRDGTLISHRGYIRGVDDVELIPGAATAVRRLNELNYRVIVITNQPIIARGEGTLSGLRRIHDKLETLLGAAGAFIDGIRFCPHHPDRGYAGEVPHLKFDCDCRKPKTGLIVDASREFNLDLSLCWLVGDTTRDIKTASNAGLRSILVRTGEGGRDGLFDAVPQFVADDIASAVDIIASQVRVRTDDH